MNEQSRRDYFAANAPDIPDWFDGPPSDVAPPSVMTMVQWRVKNESPPKPLETARETVQRNLREWNKYKAERAAERDTWERQQSARRFFAWRWHYADQMLSIDPNVQPEKERP